NADDHRTADVRQGTGGDDDAAGGVVDGAAALPRLAHQLAGAVVGEPDPLAERAVVDDDRAGGRQRLDLEQVVVALVAAGDVDAHRRTLVQHRPRRRGGDADGRGAGAGLVRDRHAAGAVVDAAAPGRRAAGG